MSSKVVENYSLMDVVGQGQYGKVYKALNLKTNQLVALKVVKVEKFKEVAKLEEFTMNEIQTLARIDNPYVMKFIEMLKSSRNYYFVYEYCSQGTLENIINDHKILPENVSLKYFKMLLKAFRSLNELSIIHRDLKPSNILIQDDIIKLGDFGFCKQLNHPQDLSQTMVGSPIYMAPGILKGQDYSSKVDIWSLGCCLYEMLYGQCPFEENTMAKLLQAVDHDPVKFHDNINPVSQKTKDLLNRMLTKDPKARIDWKELFEIGLDSSENAAMDEMLNSKKNTISSAKANFDRSKESKAFKYILAERNKVYYLYQLVDEILELSKEESNEQKESVFIFSAFLFTKYICLLIESIRINLVEKYNPSAFPTLKKKLEGADVSKSFEFKSFCNLIAKEIDLSRKMLQKMMSETQKYYNSQGNQHVFNEVNQSKLEYFESELKKEIQEPQISLNFLRKFLLKYCLDLKSQQLQLFLHPDQNQGKKWLIHLEKVLEALLIDDFFEKCIDVNQVELEQQNYFDILKKYSKADLLQLVTKKIEFIQSKLYTDK